MDKCTDLTEESLEAMLIAASEHINGYSKLTKKIEAVTLPNGVRYWKLVD